MELHKKQLKHHKKRKHLVVGGVILPIYNFWLGSSTIGGGLTMATPGDDETGEASAPTSGSNAGGDAAAGAIGSGAGGSM